MMFWGTRRARALTALAAVAATGAAVLVVGPGYETARMVMHSGTAWLASARTGQVVLVDGTTAEVTARLPVASAGSPLSVAQHGSAAVVLNRTTGELKRVDSATEQVSSPSTVLPANNDLAVLPGTDVLYEFDVHSGMVASVDPQTLAPRDEPEHLTDRMTPSGPVVDGSGRLWAVDDATGDLAWLENGRRRARPDATKPGSSLAITRDRPALVDPDRGTAELLDPATGRVTRTAKPDLQAGDAVLVSGSADRSRLLIASSTRGTLIVCDFDTASCADPVTVGSPGDDLGTPVEVRNHAVVPDHTTGQATVVDLVTSRVVAQRKLFDHPAPFELLVRDGIVFFNDPDSNRAGVLDLAGDVRTVTKYTDENADGDPAPDPDRRSQAGQVVNLDNKKQKPGVGIPPRPTVPPTRTGPVPTPQAPNPSASIVVKPGNRGVVGEEFELTVVRRPAADTARWQFGDGAEATGTTVRHRWERPGTFTVRATTSGTSAETTVIVDPEAVAPRILDLSVQRPKPVIGEKVRFSAETTGGPEKWAWRVTRPNKLAPEVTAQTPEFDHAFATPGVYTVTLTVTAGAQSTTSERQFTVVRGAVKAWGNNRYTNVSPDAQSGVVAISVGLQHSLALKPDGKVVAWGNKSYGNLAVPAEATSGVTAIAAGGFHSLALKNGRVLAWGFNFDNVLKVPQDALSGVVAISAGYKSAMALRADGTVVVWGNDDGEIPMPEEAKRDVIAIAAGGHFNLVLKEDGRVLGWGNKANGELPVPPDAMSGVVEISAGSAHSLVRKADGSVIGWGQSYWGQLPVPLNGTSGTAIQAGYMNSFVHKGNGTVVAWGQNRNGESSVPPQFNRGVLAAGGGEGFSVVLLEELD